ncbi:MULTISPECIES: thermonuclease family protein [Rhizobium]|uniref:thermonuclease family protein n=1 Tax=Rhizobium TaxID=379 RepID=UPI001B3219A8|nr:MULTISPECIES: thermonuclease family protein [Rhizobium]MBX4910301.1 thermonuclease family protein [Rhizobium bangladeshense]MBX5214672.1 thermonuclease family protein [Rhizobium sp. NLR9a]MBX5231826.1 thermonuclease family protein [Rhizobium sp. NLR4a]MBX5237150.1 thermonuclease family protein [Rhizobium sp. NLR22b]MBX5244087.1 thermonuclease family protein [Rhizobium sp. NLR3b]
MRPAAVVTGITGMAVVVGLLMAGEARLRGGTAGEETAAAEETAVAAPDVAPETAGPATISDERAEMIARSAEPAAPPPAADGAAPKPATIAQQAAPVGGETAGPAGKKALELPRPLVENAGSLSFGERRLQLAGIVPTPADRICGPAGRQWPCGMLAKTALRQLLRNRSITCDLDTAEWKGTAIAACRLGTQDLGAWLAETGWAEAEAGSSLAAVAEKAKQAQKGIYGGDPRRK